MIDRDSVLSLIFQVADEINLMLPPENRIEKVSHTVLWGESARLDSLALASFIVATEGAVEQRLGRAVNLVDEMTSSGASISTIDSLADLIMRKVSGGVGEQRA